MSLQDILIIVLIASVMLSMGLALRGQELVAVMRQPKPLLLILLVNILVLPLVGFGLAGAVSDTMALALLLAGACGIGSTAPLFTANVNGNIALATAALVISGFLSLLTMPLTLLWVGFELDGSPASLSQITLNAFKTMLYWQVLPLVLGMLARVACPTVAGRLAVVFKHIGNLTLLVLIVGISVTQGHLLLSIPLAEIMVLSALVLATYCLPSILYRKPWGSALVFCTCTRNLNLALLLASQVFMSDKLILAILTYAFVMYLLLPPFTLWHRRKAVN